MPRLFSGFLLLAGLLVLGVAWFLWRRGEASRGWTRTAGRVVVSQVEEFQGPPEQGYPQFRPELRYQYSVAGRDYEGSDVGVGSAAGAASAEPSWARKELERFPVGTEVAVYYDPADPRRAVLERGVPPLLPVVAVVGMALLVAGLWLLSR